MLKNLKRITKFSQGLSQQNAVLEFEYNVLHNQCRRAKKKKKLFNQIWICNGINVFFSSNFYPQENPNQLCNEGRIWKWKKNET